MRRRSIFLALVAGLSASVVASAKAEPAPSSPKPGPEMQKLVETLAGTWSVSIRLEPSEKMPKGGASQGTEIYRPGPGGLSLVEEFQESSGTLSGLGLAWWDEAARGYRAVWCDRSNAQGCRVMTRLARWEGSQFVLGDEWEDLGKKFTFKEVFSDITPSSFTQTLYQGESGGEPRPIMTIRATKLTRSGSSPGAR